MKKTLTLVLTLLLVAVFTTTALADPGNGKAWSNSNGKKVVDTKKVVPPGQQKKELKNFNQIEKAIKKSLQEQYRVTKEKPEKVKVKRFRDTYHHWAAQCIEEMAAIGLLAGYPDGSFKPDQKLTQAEALSLVMRIAAEEAGISIKEDVAESEDEKVENEDQSKVVDIPAWVRADADKAAKRGIIKLNRFHSAVQASRAQTAVMIAKALGLEPVDTSKMPFKDGILISREDVGYILALYEEGIISGHPNGNFNPNSAITRAEMATILQKLLDKDEPEEEPEDKTPQDIDGTFETTSKIGVHDGKVYQEYKFVVDAQQVSLAQDNVKSITMQKEGVDPVKLTPNTDKTLWFNVQRESGKYTIKVVDKDDNSYEAVLDWVAPKEVAATATGRSGEHDSNSYIEYKIGDLNLSSFTCMYQIKPNGEVAELTANTDTNLWFKTNDQITGKHIFLINIENVWYSANISI